MDRNYSPSFLFFHLISSSIGPRPACLANGGDIKRKRKEVDEPSCEKKDPEGTCQKMEDKKKKEEKKKKSEVNTTFGVARLNINLPSDNKENEEETERDKEVRTRFRLLAFQEEEQTCKELARFLLNKLNGEPE